MPTFTTPEQRARQIGRIVQTSPDFMRDYQIQEGTDPFEVARKLYAQSKTDPDLAAILKSAESQLGGPADIGEMPSPLATGLKSFGNSALIGLPELALRHALGYELFKPGETTANWKSAAAGDMASWAVPAVGAAKLLKVAARGAKMAPGLIKAASAIANPGAKGAVEVGLKGRAGANAALGVPWALGQQTNLQQRGMTQGTRAPGDYTYSAAIPEVASASIGIPTGGILAKKGLEKVVPYTARMIGDKAAAMRVPLWQGAGKTGRLGPLVEGAVESPGVLSRVWSGPGKSAALGAAKFGTAGALGGAAYEMGVDPEQTLGSALSSPTAMFGGGLMGLLGAGGGVASRRMMAGGLKNQVNLGRASRTGAPGELAPEVAAVLNERPQTGTTAPPESPQVQAPSTETSMNPRVPPQLVNQAMPRIQALVGALNRQGIGGRWDRFKTAVGAGINAAGEAWKGGSPNRIPGQTLIQASPEGEVSNVIRAKGFKPVRIPSMVNRLDQDQLTTEIAPHGIRREDYSHWSTETMNRAATEPIPMEFKPLGAVRGPNGYLPGAPVRVGDKQLQLIGYTTRSLEGQSKTWDPSVEEVALSDIRTGRTVFMPAGELPDAITWVTKKLADEAGPTAQFEGLDPVLEAVPSGKQLLQRAMGIFSPEDTAAMEDAGGYEPLLDALRLYSQWGAQRK